MSDPLCDNGNKNIMNASLTNAATGTTNGESSTTDNNALTTHHPEPLPELIADIRKRLAELPPDIAQYVDEALRREPIEHVANFLWKAGHPVFMSSELYEYRRTLFPPGAMLDPYTAGPPVLRQESTPCISPINPSAQPPSILHPSSGAALLSDLRNTLNRYVVLPEMAAEALALWVVHTYAFTLRQVTTYIGVVSPEKRCGKTTLLELLGLLANRSLTAANISSSAVFRVIEETQPTLLIDEADTFLQGRDELAGILNAGYRKGNSYVVRVADRRSRKPPVGPVPSPGDPASSSGAPQPEFGQWSTDPVDSLNSQPTDFAKYSCWCPKVMATIGRLPDTLADRCILITMQRKMPGEKCERLRHLNAADLRMRCADFVREHRETIAHAQPPIPSTLNDRAADIWEPLFALADLAGGQWPELARQASQKLSASDDDLTLIGYFLKDLRNLMVLKNVDRIDRK